jgi:GTP-binding protein
MADALVRAARGMPAQRPAPHNPARRVALQPCCATRPHGTGRKHRESKQMIKDAVQAEEEAARSLFASPAGRAAPPPAGAATAAEPASFLSAFDKIQMMAGPEEDDDVPADGAQASLDAFFTEELGPEEGAEGADAGAGGPEEYEGLPVFFAEGADPAAMAAEAAAAGGRRSRRPRPPQIPEELLPRVAIVGRPNVGKSALFNRIVGKQVAIVFDYPGVTRDRLYTRASWGGREFMLVDTGGLMSDAAALPQEQQAAAIRSIGAAGLPGAIERQAAAAVEESDAVILVVDGQTGATSEDAEVLAWLRRSHPGKHVSLAVNKCENSAKADLQAAEFWELGLEPVAVSAISGLGTGDLMQGLVGALPAAAAAAAVSAADEAVVAVAIVGRPNVGKSSLLNALVGEERSIVSPVAGTTRDAVDMDLTTPDGRAFTLIDTAGVRKRASIAGGKDGAEPLSVERAFRAVRRAEVAVLVIDATEGITVQDFRLAEYIAESGRACVVAVNKWDAIPAKTGTTLSDFEANVRAQLRPVEWANVVFTSARTGQRVTKVLDAATAAAEEHRRRITTATLNLVVQDAVGWRSPPSAGSGKRGRIYYGTQAGVQPPSFVLFVNDPKLFADDYRKYMERQLRENIGYPGTPLRVYWRGKNGASAE